VNGRFLIEHAARRPAGRLWRWLTTAERRRISVSGDAETVAQPNPETRSTGRRRAGVGIEPHQKLMRQGSGSPCKSLPALPSTGRGIPAKLADSVYHPEQDEADALASAVHLARKVLACIQYRVGIWLGQPAASKGRRRGTSVLLS
jgi:hypothetical protein